jgi:dTDP-4-dehydrorhamnose 3,5-epimerase
VDVRQLEIPDAYVLTPRVFEDERGAFCEFYRHEALAEAVGHRLDLAQGNCSVSRRGVVRGIHFSDTPPGQAKYVTCLAGEVLDVVVDLRVGSPAFGRWTAVPLDERSRRAVYLAEGLGHAFCAVSESATVAYLCSTVYTPGAEHGVHPLDPALAVDWPAPDPVLSAKDDAAPSLAQAREAGLLPSYPACAAHYAQLSAAAVAQV